MNKHWTYVPDDDLMILSRKVASMKRNDVEQACCCISCVISPATASHTSARRQKSTSKRDSYNTHHLSRYGLPCICRDMDINVTTRQLQYTSPVSPWPAEHLQRDRNQRQTATATIHITCLTTASRTSAKRQKSTSKRDSYNTHHPSHYGQPNICRETGNKPTT